MLNKKLCTCYIYYTIKEINDLAIIQSRCSHYKYN